ncbi:cytochrome c oxidase assembly protein [Actinomycetospora endophytica]|uniref:Cytochrome c oxidase assembly protein n=1 Tax=Actinomycetospora endophytica TaxID=2291215 RepID=A0ABS8P658_9PSEU|nr:cytochrome c oxidase assembly protein [Actinomycetospora endophytica]MCD2193741.1 cytochrome c oxidase assembly protein [Actinomycetospora endophytica]
MSALLTTWRTTWGAELVVTALAALYLRSVLHVGGWPLIRTVSAMAALVAAVVAVDSGVGIRAPRSFAVGVVLQLLLTVVVPALWVAGRPVELVRRGCSERTASRLDQLGRIARTVAGPAVALVVYALVVVLTRLTTFPVAVAASPVLSVLQQLVWLGAGLLFFRAALAPSYTVRFSLLTAATVVTIAVGGILASSSAGSAPTFAPDDVHRGGTILWAAGGGLLVVITAALGVRALREGGRH